MPLHAETRPRFVEPDWMELPAVPIEHRPVLLVQRTDDCLHEIHETGQPANIMGAAIECFCTQLFLDNGPKAQTVMISA